MKKLILILLLFVSVLGYSQGYTINYKSLTSIPAYTMDGDTSYVIHTTNQFYFDFQIVWASLDQTDGSVKIEISNDGTNYEDYPNMDTLLLNSATGTGIIRDTFKGTAGNYLKISVDSGTCSSGTLSIYGNIATKP